MGIKTGYSLDRIWASQTALDGTVSAGYVRWPQRGAGRANLVSLPYLLDLLPEYESLNNL